MTGSVATRTGAPPPGERFRAWFLEGLGDQAVRHQGPHAREPEEHKQHAWWRVMCLTGVDYFSTLGYQPGIAALAAGAVAPLATVVLVVLTLLGALPVYRRVARESPRGEGSIAMLEHILPWWSGKLVVLVLLGFAATDFLITMTLSAADAAAHAVENPYAPSWFHGHQIVITLVLLALLAAVFLRGFTEAIGIAVVLVGAYLVLNAIVVADGVLAVVAHPHLFSDWHRLLLSEHPNWLAVAGTALIVFPKLALGLSGFETGVAVMPQIQGDPEDTPKNPAGRIRGAHRLLTTAALIMSVFLILSSFVTILLIPAAAFKAGGPANGRALAYLAHQRLGGAFGTIYDVSTIGILWFAGASAMAGLLNLVPRYLPRYGMAPRWAKAIRPLVLVFAAVAFLVTWVFRASVDAQGGAYATGVLVLITSASLAVTLSARRHRQRALTWMFGAVAAVFVYTTVENIRERPDGVKIGGLFILAILLVSFASRVRRAFELRATTVDFDETAMRFIDDAVKSGTIRIVANEPDERNAKEYRQKSAEVRALNDLPKWAPLIFLEVTVEDASEFERDLRVVGEDRFGYRILKVRSSVIANTVAEILLEIRERTTLVPHVYFTWTEGNPLLNLLKFLFVGEGEVAPITREVLRQAEANPKHRPKVHVG